jgi:tRNA pseudouridine38-40 synthase
MGGLCPSLRPALPCRCVWSQDRQTLLFEVRYLGRYFFGVEAQVGRRTVASELTALVEQALGLPLHGLVFASRTDSGVNAEQNFASGWVRGQIDPRALEALSLPSHCALQVTRALQVPRSVQARNGARHKHYQYRIVGAEGSEHDAWRVVPPVDPQRMRLAARALIGQHDFAAFRAKTCQARSTIKTLARVDISEDGTALLIDVEGDGFLRKMVRVLVGTLVAVGTGLQPASAIAEILASRDRRLAGITAPAQGLTLKRVQLHWPGQRHAGMPLAHRH